MLETETTIDRSFDQTAEHTHFRGIDCQTCQSTGIVPAHPPDAEPFRPVSPVMLDHRVFVLQRELEATRNSHLVTMKERDDARIRIKQLERFNAEISVKVDVMLEKLSEVTSQNPIQILYPNHKPAA